MKSLTIHTLVVAVAMTLWATTSMAGEVSNLSMGSSEEDTISAVVATSPAPLHALSRLDTQSLAEQEMSDQELKAIEGGAPINDGRTTYYGTLKSGYDLKANAKL
jgi:bacteriocin-like protein